MVQLIFWHKAKLGRVKVRSERRQYDSGVLVATVPEIVAEFGIDGGEYEYTTPEGTMDRAADIRGHYFDLDQQAREKGWSDHEKELVKTVLLQVAQREPEMVRVHEKPKAQKPWPKYDEAHHNQIPTLAEQLGLVAEAIAYERENKNRESVIAKLEELSRQEVAEPEELTAA